MYASGTAQMTGQRGTEAGRSIKVRKHNRDIRPMFFGFHEQRREVCASAPLEFDVAKVGHSRLVPHDLADAVVADDESKPGLLAACDRLDLKRKPLQKGVIDRSGDIDNHNETRCWLGHAEPRFKRHPGIAATPLVCYVRSRGP